jgi:hypothetical protein
MDKQLEEAESMRRQKGKGRLDEGEKNKDRAGDNSNDEFESGLEDNEDRSRSNPFDDNAKSGGPSDSNPFDDKADGGGRSDSNPFNNKADGGGRSDSNPFDDNADSGERSGSRLNDKADGGGRSGSNPFDDNADSGERSGSRLNGKADGGDDREQSDEGIQSYDGYSDWRYRNLLEADRFGDHYWPCTLVDPETDKPAKAWILGRHPRRQHSYGALFKSRNKAYPGAYRGFWITPSPDPQDQDKTWGPICKYINEGPNKVIESTQMSKKALKDRGWADFAHIAVFVTKTSNGYHKHLLGQFMGVKSQYRLFSKSLLNGSWGKTADDFFDDAFAWSGQKAPPPPKRARMHRAPPGPQGFKSVEGLLGNVSKERAELRRRRLDEKVVDSGEYPTEKEKLAQDKGSQQRSKSVQQNEPAMQAQQSRKKRNNDKKSVSIKKEDDSEDEVPLSEIPEAGSKAEGAETGGTFWPFTWGRGK